MDLQVWIRDILLSLFIAAAVIVFLCQPVKVEGTSMLPQLADEQRIFVNKLVYRIDRIERGDVIVFRFPEDLRRSYIKRVVGLPGETVEVRKGAVHIDGKTLTEPYVPQRYRDRASHPPFTVPEGAYYVLGDHRNTSNDSRTWGTVDKSFITGKAVFAYWPPERFGVVH
jgi:signal peptidase I